MSSDVSAPTGIGGLGFSFNPDALTAESLLTYCQTQLSDLDSQVNAYMDQQKLALKQKELMGTVENTMKKYHDGKWNKGDGFWPEVDAAFDKAIAGLPEGDPVRQQLIDLKNEMHIAGDEKGISVDQLKNYTEKLHGVVESVNGNAELNMIQLQSIMSKRQTAIQLTTNMLAKYDQSVAGIVSNMK